MRDSREETLSPYSKTFTLKTCLSMMRAGAVLASTNIIFGSGIIGQLTVASSRCRGNHIPRFLNLVLLLVKTILVLLPAALHSHPTSGNKPAKTSGNKPAKIVVIDVFAAKNVAKTVGYSEHLGLRRMCWAPSKA